MVCLRNTSVDALHKGDTEHNDTTTTTTTTTNNNNNNYYYYYYYYFNGNTGLLLAQNSADHPEISTAGGPPYIQLPGHQLHCASCASEQ